jgi:amidophosphoribosyltransferase
MMTNNPVAQEMYDGLIILQHRGQDAAGIMSFDGEMFHHKKGVGLVRDVFDEHNMARLKGSIAIGHTRYPTWGGCSKEDAQPQFSAMPYGIAMAHNGNVFNSSEVKEELVSRYNMMVNSNNDIEVILGVFRHSLLKDVDKDGEFKIQHVWKAVRTVHRKCRGGYSVVAYIAGKGLVAFRDPYGLRPLQVGKRTRDLRPEWIVSSETVVLDVLDFDLVGDVKNGEAIFIDDHRALHRKTINKQAHRPCSFEYVYLARPDSLLDDVSVHKARLRMGRKLGKQIKKNTFSFDAIMPVPDSSREAAVGVSDVLKVPYREGIVKNRYIGRTFIMPGQSIRKKSIRHKLNVIPHEVAGKSVLLVDDSIVRGNTLRQVVEMVRKAGAKKVYVASAAPALRFPCVYGVDMPTKSDFVANQLTVQQIAAEIGADGLYYQRVDDLRDSIKEGNKKIKKPCLACFTGNYPTKDVDKMALDNAERTREMTHQEVEASGAPLPMG